MKLTTVERNPTIGVGFDLVTGSKELKDKVLSVMGFSSIAITSSSRPADAAAAMDFDYLARIRKEFVTVGNVDAINDVMLERSRQTNKDFLKLVGTNLRSSFKFASENEVKAIFPIVWEDYQASLENRFDQLATDAGAFESREILTMASFTWNGGAKLLGDKFRTALANGDRATAWFELRYNTNRSNLSGIQNGGISNPRYLVSTTTPTTSVPPKRRACCRCSRISVLIS